MKLLQTLGLAAFGALACGAPDDASDLYRATTRTYPDGGIVETLEPIGQLEQDLVVDYFMGWRGGMEGLKRGARCTLGPDPAQTCYVPIRKLARWYVDPAGFSAADLQAINDQLAADHAYLTALLPISELGWTVEPGTANDYNVKIVAGSVSGALFPASDSRHWSQLGCEASTTLTETVSRPGVWKGCSRVLITLDVGKLLDDGAAASRRTPRIKQTASQALHWGMGLGIGNIYGGTSYQIAAASTSTALPPWMENSQLCALDRFDAANKTSVSFTDCGDGAWEWPE